MDPYDTIDPSMGNFLKALRDNEKPPNEWNIQEMRASPLLTPSPDYLEEVHSVEDRQVRGIPIRVFRPSGKGPFPLVMFFHGGGFVFGSVVSSEGLPRRLCNRLGAVVISVEYRLAPEHKFPAGLEDCYDATHWAVERASELGVDPKRVVVSGESAGGNFAAAVALQARDEAEPPIAAQVLLYPALSMRPDQKDYRTSLDQHFVTYDSLQWYRGKYLKGPEEANHPYVTPLKAKDLTGLPSAIIVSAEHDPLTADCHRYAQRLQEAGVSVDEIVAPGAIHCFLNFPVPTPQAEPILEQLVSKLRAILGE